MKAVQGLRGLPRGVRTDGRKVLTRVLVGLLGIAAMLAGIATNRLIEDLLLSLVAGGVVFLVLVSLLLGMSVGENGAPRR